jgi:hypothetical protein
MSALIVPASAGDVVGAAAPAGGRALGVWLPPTAVVPVVLNPSGPVTTYVALETVTPGAISSAWPEDPARPWLLLAVVCPQAMSETAE